LDKRVLLRELEDAVRAGRELSVRDLAGRLDSSEGTTKKALVDLGKAIAEWSGTQRHRSTRILLSSSAKVSLDHAWMLKRAEDRERAYLEIIENLPEALELLMPLPGERSPAPTADPDDSVGPEWVRRLNPRFERQLHGLEHGVLVRVRDAIARLSMHHIAALTARHSGRIVAVQLPSHRVEEWDEALRILDVGYKAFKRDRGELFRIVVLPQSAPLAWWRKLWHHIDLRLDKDDKVWAVTEASAASFDPGLTSDLVLLENHLAALVQPDDLYPRHVVGLHPKSFFGRQVQNTVLEALALAQQGDDPRFVRCEGETFAALFNRDTLDTWLKQFAKETRPVFKVEPDLPETSI